MKRRHTELSDNSSQGSTAKKPRDAQRQSKVAPCQTEKAHKYDADRGHLTSPTIEYLLADHACRAPDAVNHLIDRADDLVECLQSLKKQGKDADPALTKRLASLSRELLPSFESFAHSDEVVMETPTRNDKPEVPVLTPWAPSDVSRELPPLPPVLDPSLEQASFTHVGMVKNRGERSYEQLEWLGDAYLYLISTIFIFQTFPHLSHGDMCQIREVLVRNATLKDYALHYGFDKRTVLPEEYGLDGRKGGTKISAKERTKVLGDVFEAHVAAIILADPIRGVSKTASWLKALWSTTIPEQIKTRTWQGHAPPLIVPAMGSTEIPVDHQQQSQGVQSNGGNAKEKLSGDLCLFEPRVTVEYRSLDEGMPEKRDPLTNNRLFTQGAFLVGYGETVQLGVGTDKKKAKANEKAAQCALENKKLMNAYREKKRAVQESKRAAEQKASKGLDF